MDTTFARDRNSKNTIEEKTDEDSNTFSRASGSNIITDSKQTSFKRVETSSK